MDAKKKQQAYDLQLSFDVGHSSIGWAVIQSSPNKLPAQVNLLGCGAVVFRADDCLVSARRDYRRQRRHIRSTRQRIRRMKLLLAHLGVLNDKALDKPGCAWPWKLAGRVLAGKGDRKTLLTWPELWDVLRWYAHNRGYDGNRRWSGEDSEAAAEDSEKEQNARSLMARYGTATAAETVCAVCGIDPLGIKNSSNLAPTDRFRSKNAAFPRALVEAEVRQIIRVHAGVLPCVDVEFERALLGENSADQRAWNAIPCPKLKLPARFQGGLLFGQLVPRFDNRIISRCAISGVKVPVRNCPEFLNFRWAMTLANIRVADRLGDLRPLSAVERASVNSAVRERGYFTPGELKDAVRKVTGSARDNLDTMLMHPDAKESLIVEPVRKLQTSEKVSYFWPLLPLDLQKRISGQWRRGKSVNLAQILDLMRNRNHTVSAIEDAIQKKLDATNLKAGKKGKQLAREAFVKESLALPKLSGRAPYARTLLTRAFQEVMEGKHPKEAGNCLFISDEIRSAQLNRPIAEQTNNHLVRHRLLILERLLTDIVKDYAGGDKERVAGITVEVNRDLREMSGKTAKEKAQDMGQRLSNHHSVAAKLEACLPGVAISAGLIRKGRIAEDLGWVCPYTGQIFEPKDLATRRVDKDHIVPRSDRASDSLDSLVITYSEVNKMKGKRTAMEFVAKEQGKAVPGAPHLSIVSLTRYRQFVDGLECYKGHDDDKRRKRNRKDFLRLESYVEKEFVPRDLTQTSQLVRLAAQMLRRAFVGCNRPPVIVSLPGSVTGVVRKAWKLTGCLSLASPQVLEENGEVKSKTDIRDITHLHHALDACVLGFASIFIPNQGRVWELIVKRNPNQDEQRELMITGVFNRNKEGRCELRDLDSRLKEQIRQRLAEKRVVQHLPARMDGLRLEQNIWRVVSVDGDNVTIQQRMRKLDGSLDSPKLSEEKAGKLLGLSPVGNGGKLKALKGVLVIPDNFGLALDPHPTIVPFHKVWNRLSELKAANGGKWPRILRNGQIIEVPKGTFKGTWKIFSLKNNASGISLDIGAPDVVRLKNKTPGHKINVLLSSLLANEMRIVRVSLTGVACPTTSST